jgi:hypothetical protein
MQPFLRLELVFDRFGTIPKWHQQTAGTYEHDRPKPGALIHHLSWLIRLGSLPLNLAIAV